MMMRRGHFILLVFGLMVVTSPFYLNLSQVESGPATTTLPTVDEKLALPADATPSVPTSTTSTLIDQLKAQVPAEKAKPEQFWICRCANRRCNSPNRLKNLVTATTKLRRQCGNDCIPDCHADNGPVGAEKPSAPKSKVE